MPAKKRRGRREYGIEDEVGSTPQRRSSARSTQIKREVNEILARKPSILSGKRTESSGDGGIAKAREISERRLAALIANGEDARNTPAWRDAVAESRMIDRMARARAGADPNVPFGRRSGIDRSKHTRVDIRWGAIPNQNKVSGGFLPMIEEDGKARGDTWSGRGYDKAEAEAMAEEQAHEAASRFVGDWNVHVTKGLSGGRSHATTKQRAKTIECMVTASIRLSGAPAAMQTREFKHRADAQAWLDQQREIADRRGWHGYRFELTEQCKINKVR
jgi:hypothetical protein